MQQPNMEPEEEMPKGVILRDFDDFTTLRNQIFEGVKNSMSKAFPVKYGNVRLELHDVDYDDVDDVPVSQQKKMLLENKYITKKLRGTIKLFDDTNDQLLEEKRLSLMKVPYLTNRGTFIHGGNEYATIMQSRLLPGVYTRRQENGELETQFNVKPGTGVGFRVGFEPETTQYRLKISQANLHLYSLLKDIGMDEKELEAAWGPEIYRANRGKYDARVFDKAYERLVPARQKKLDKTREDKINSIKAALDSAQIHARVAQKNLPNMFDPKIAAEWEARWQGKQAAERVIDSMPFEPDLTPEEVLESYFDEEAGIKSAADMRALMQARQHSARAKQEYKKKTAIMAAAMARFPDEFIVDQDGRMSGITHVPTGFRIHIPREFIPKQVKRVFAEQEDDAAFDAQNYTSPYQEEDTSHFTHAGNKYDLNKALLAVKDQEASEVPVGDLSWILEHSNPSDAARVNKADLSAPILVGDHNGKKVVLDGIHRLRKAVDSKVDKLPARFLTKEQLAQAALYKRAAEEDFMPDFKPEEIQDAYNAIYGHYGPRLASMEKWPEEWINKDVDEMGWLQWYEQYKAGRRTDDDERQIKRWKSFKARHGSQFKNNPTPRRAFALRNWAIDPLKLLDDEEDRSTLAKAMEEYKQKAWDKYNNND